MKLNTLGNAYRRITFSVFLFVFAAILLVVALIMTNSSNKEGYVETTATIEEIIPNQIDAETTIYQVFVNYVVDGTPYNHIEINSYDSSYAVGKEITILYDANNPANIVGKTSVFLIILLYALAALSAVGGVITTYLFIRSKSKEKEIKNAPLITSEGREIGEPQKLYFSLDKKTHVKLRFFMEDEFKNVLYEGKMIKHNLVGAHTYLFTDHVKHTETEHKVGHVNTAGSDSMTVSQGFTFDGVEITDYFNANNINVSYNISGNGFIINVQHNGQPVAKAITSSQYVHEEDAAEHAIASKFRFNQYFYQIEGQPSYVDVIFLVLFKEALSPRANSLL